MISDTRDFYPEDYQSIESGQTVYVITSVLDRFVEEILPDLESAGIKFRLVTGACVIGVPKELSQIHGFDYIQRLFERSSSVIAWFSQNFDLDSESPLIRPIPLGLDYHTLQRGSHWWGRQATAVRQEEQLKEAVNSSLPFKKRLNRTLSFYQFEMTDRNGGDRYKAIEALASKEFNEFLSARYPRKLLWRECIKYKYIISPHGHGLDCHRTYEAVCLGCLPVVKSSSLDLLYKDMPVIIVDDWDKVDLEFLSEKSAIINTNSKVKLMLAYWIDYIREYKPEEFFVGSKGD